MKLYKRLTYIAGTLSIASFILCLVLHYAFTESNETSFWINICLSVLGSSLLSLLTSLISYFHERRLTLEGFVYSTRRILRLLNHYQVSMSLDEKIRFFLMYCDVSKDEWDSYFGNIDFFFERIHHKRKGIYEHIYTPILLFNQTVGKKMWNFRWHLDGSGKNDRAMTVYISELESYLITEKTYDIPVEYSKNGSPTQFCHITSQSTKLVDEIYTELNGDYFNCIYSKEIKKEKTEKINNNEQNENGVD